MQCQLFRNVCWSKLCFTEVLDCPPTKSLELNFFSMFQQKCTPCLANNRTLCCKQIVHTTTFRSMMMMVYIYKTYRSVIFVMLTYLLFAWSWYCFVLLRVLALLLIGHPYYPQLLPTVFQGHSLILPTVCYKHYACSQICMSSINTPSSSCSVPSTWNRSRLWFFFEHFYLRQSKALSLL